MGWSDCGEDSKGRPIGYAFEATCDHPGCTKEIDRGLAYACGGMHGEGDNYCEGYFCAEHLVFVDVPLYADRGGFVCPACDALIPDEEHTTHPMNARGKR
jgi:hypothetical protein